MRWLEPHIIVHIWLGKQVRPSCDDKLYMYIKQFSQGGI